MNKKIVFIILGVAILGVILGTVLNFEEKEVVEERKVKTVSFEPVDNLLKENKFSEARQLLREKKENLTDSLAIKEAQEKIYKINTRILFSPYRDECSKIYTVQSGDALSKIARQFNTTVNLIKRSNNLTSDRIIPGQRLKVNTCRFSVVVDKSQNRLFLRRAGEIFKAYTVATGEAGSTPEGKFKIVNKLVDPTWYRAGAVVLPDDPDNILGTRWMGFDKPGYGIHGTTEPETLGQQVTLGCIRMANEEVEELYDILPVGTEVLVVE